MKFNYFADTDSLYIKLASQPSTESMEVSEGVVIDYHERGNLVGIDIDNARAPRSTCRSAARQSHCEGRGGDKVRSFGFQTAATARSQIS